MKKSFIIYKDALDILDEISDEQAGKLFKAIKEYQNGEEPELDIVTKMIFIPFRNQFIRDGASYEKIVERNRKNGKNGGRPTETEKPTKPEKPKETQKTQSVIPDYNEFSQYAYENAKDLDEEKLKLKYKSWTENDWKDGHHKPIKNWKTKLLNSLQYLKNEKRSSTQTGSKAPATYNRSKAIDTSQTLFGGDNRET